MVSVEPSIVQTTLPTYESGPYFPMISDTMARDALPDTGLIRTSGMASAGIPSNEAAGVSKPTIASRAPEALKTPIAVRIPTSEGNILITVETPSAAPSVNASNILTFRLSPAPSMTRMVTGSMYMEMEVKADVFISPVNLSFLLFLYGVCPRSLIRA